MILDKFKEIISYLRSKTNGKSLLFIVIIIIAFIGFQKSIEKLYIDFIVDNILSKFSPSVIIEYLILILLIASFALFCKRIRINYQISTSQFFISIVIAIVY